MLNTITRTRAIFIIAAAAFAAGCAGGSKPDAGGPRANEQPYPVIYQPSPDRVDEVKAVWTNLSRGQGGGAVSVLPDLSPVTATIKALPASGNIALRLPKIGLADRMSNEDTRESLKRFVDQTKVLIGADPQQLSLVSNNANGSSGQLAIYAQSPFRYPIRNGFGVVRIGYDDSRRVSQFSSTCIPNLGTFQRMLTGIRTLLTAEQAKEAVPGK